MTSNLNKVGEAGDERANYNRVTMRMSIQGLKAGIFSIIYHWNLTQDSEISSLYVGLSCC